MGINNLCKLLNTFAPPATDPDPYDSILVDCQSFLYIAIEHSLETRESKLFQEICESTWHQLYAFLKLFNQKNLVVILSFDGEGVPMKWPTQRERRKHSTSRKSFYRYTLFGNNRLTIHVQDYLLDKLKQFNQTLTVVLAGCNVPGEGEHKIFHVAESFPGCRNPVVVSVDQDVFVLAFLRLDRFQTIQIYRYKQFYHITRLATLLSPRHFIHVSFLFGNDFIPVLVGISPNNAARIHKTMFFEGGDAPAVLAEFIRRMEPCMRFDRVDFIDHSLVVCFWMTYFWILDYYTTRHFPQQFLENRVYDAFDRNQLLTALLDETYSRRAYAEAKETYDSRRTQPIPHAERHIFTDEALLNDLRVYWIEPTNTLCNVLRLTSARRNLKRGSNRNPPTGTGATPEMERI